MGRGDNSSEPDDLNFHFIKKCWEFRSSEFLSMMRELLENGPISRGENPSLIILILIFKNGI